MKIQDSVIEHFRGSEYVMVQKSPPGFGPGSGVCVDANEDGAFEFETTVGSDGIWALTFDFFATRENHLGKPLTTVSWYFVSSDGDRKSDVCSADIMQMSTENRAKAIPENCAGERTDGATADEEFLIEPGICSCQSCPDNDTLMASSLEGFSNSFTPREQGVETVSGKYRCAYPITSFSTRMLGFEFNLHHATLVKYDGPAGQNFSHGFNMMIVRDAELSGRIVTPDLRIFPIESKDGINWYLPDGFNARLCCDPVSHRWVLTHYSGLEIAFYLAQPGCPGYPISISDPNGNSTCLLYNGSGFLTTITTDLGQVQQFEYDSDGYLCSYTDHIDRQWQFCHDGEGRLTAIESPATTYADIAAGQEITAGDLDRVLVSQPRCQIFGYQDACFPYQMTSERDPRGAIVRESIYDEKGRVVTARINNRDLQFGYVDVELPRDVTLLDAGNMLRSVTDREGNITLHEVHGIDGGPINQQGRFGLRRSITLTERGKGNPPLREGEPHYWETRWLHDCDCLNPIVETQSFGSNDLETIEFDEFGIPTNVPREIFTYNQFHQRISWSYADGIDSISKQWSYQEHAFGDRHQYSRMLTESDAREFDERQIYRGINFIHRHRYDDAGNHIEHSAPTVSLGTDTPQKITERWSYNRFGQRRLYTDANGNNTHYTYFTGNSSGGDINTRGRFGGYLKSVTRGARGSADSPTKLRRQYLVNSLGMVTAERDENGFKYGTRYNNLQETVREVQPRVTLQNGQRVQYENRFVYDAAGNLVITRRSNIDVDGQLSGNDFIDSSSSFDSVNNLLSSRVEVDDDEVNDLITRYAYDGNDDLAVTQKPEGNREFRLYDERRLLLKTFYGVEPAAPRMASATSSSELLSGFPNDKRETQLDNVSFTGLTRHEYDSRGNEIRSRDGRGNTEHHFFDFYNRPVAYADANGNGWIKQYDDASNPLTEARGSVDQATGQVTEILQRSYSRFDELGRLYQQVLDVDLSSDESDLLNPDDGLNSSYQTRFDAGSRAVCNIDANGNQRSMGYDAANRLVATTDALGNQQLNSYDRNSNVVEIREIELPGPGSDGEPEQYLTSFRYDELNRQTERHIRGRDGNSFDHAWLFAYDSRNNQRLQQDAEGNVTVFSFDDRNRQVSMQRFDGDPFSGESIELQRYQWRYDRNDNMIEERALADVSDARSWQITLHSFDNLDRRVRLVLPDSDDSIAETDNGPDRRRDRIDISYDENSNPVQLIDQRGVEFYTAFDPGNRATEQSIVLPVDVPGTRRQSYRYDSLNRITEASNDYARVDQEYDSLSRLVSETQSIRLDGTGFDNDWEQPVRIDHRYDRQSNCIAYQVNSEGRRELEVTTDFDELNRTKGIAAGYFNNGTNSDPRSIAEYCYLGPARVQQKRLGNGARLHCSYDTKRRLKTHYWYGAQRELVGFEYDYDRMDNALFERFVHDQGLCDHFQYNNRYELTGVSYRVPGILPPVESASRFEYDDNFNRHRAHISAPFESGPAREFRYRVNRANEYTLISRDGEFSQDGDGGSISDNPGNSGSTPFYDRAGNSTQFLLRPLINNPSREDVTSRVRWDAFNLLFDVEPGGLNAKQHYRYDPLRRRIAALEVDDGSLVPGSRRYIYDGWNVVEERQFDAGATLASAPSSLERIYVHGASIDEPLLTAIDHNLDGALDDSRDKNLPDPDSDREYYFLDNRIGSVMALLDASNPDRVLEYYRYSAFGEPAVIPVLDSGDDGLEDTLLNLSDNIPDAVESSSAFANTFGFCGRRIDNSTGLYYYRNRYFDRVSGRFLSRDLESYVDGLNLYSYVQNNPVNWQDPLGLSRSRADCIECRVAVIYSGSLGTSRAARYYTESSAAPLPSFINRRYWGLAEQKLERISLQARVKTDRAPCCCKADARGTIKHSKVLPDLSDPSFDPGNGIREALKEYDPLAEPNLTDEILGKITSQYKASKALHKLVLGSITFALKKTQFVNQGSKQLNCKWQTVSSVLDLGGVPTIRSAQSQLVVGGKTVCDITLAFKEYKSAWEL